MENNDYNQLEVNQDTIIEEPWAHQFEQEEAQETTRSSRHQSTTKSSLYTKIIFVVFFLIILVVGVWAVLKGANLLNGTSQQGSTTPAVPKLVLQSQTTQATTTSAQSNMTQAVTTTKATETTQVANTTQENQTNTTGQTGTYTIKAGDSASTIAAAHQMTITEFYALNGFTEQTVLLPGNIVRVSSGITTNMNTANTSANANTNTNVSEGEYVIKAGDSIYSISEAHGMSMSEFKQLNGFTDESLLLPGQVVKVTR